MLRAFCLTMTIFVLSRESAFADTSLDPGGNAALKYWQSFATLPKFTDAENEKIKDWPTTPLDESARKMVTDAEYSLQMLRRGAALERCDWGMSFEDGIFALLPHANAARVLASLACLRGRLRYENGQIADGIDDFFASMTLGRHVSLDGTLITVLVGYNIERRTIDALSLYLPKLDARTINDVKTRFDALPPFGNQAVALLTVEKQTLEWFIRKVKETKNKESLLAFLSWVDISEGKERDSSEKAPAFLQECGGTAEGMIKFADEALPWYDATAKLFDLPLDEFEKEFKRESIKRNGNPVYKLFFPALDKARQSSARTDVRRALFLAAIAVQLNGKDVLQDHPDPVNGGRFEYTPFPGGFELHSKLKGQDDKPVTLTVGQRK